ncbi:DUF4962 domain-containing protein [uncultured Metabacillus sp.]|uniref:DUF4962 domain-containing protein n=1 Tax=uncultured Metabacillus sp. TaxID=2860135 RepID=UPI0026031C3A|nr:DUF4962 domain-containing protein [uncultured Metabacillus sp.]
MHFELRFFRKSFYLITSLCVFLSGCLHSEEEITKTEHEFPQNTALPSGQEIIKSLKENSPNKEHPRLMATDTDFKRIKKELKTDENLKKWYNSLQLEADRILQEPAVKYEISDGKRLLPISGEVLKRTVNLAMMYRLTGNNRYANRAWKDLSTVADDKQFPNWNPTHFLDTAEMTLAVAIGYDWLYDYLSFNQKEILRTALMKKGLQPALEVYRGTAKASEISMFWKDVTHNWNTISNGGIGVGALAIADESPETEALSGEVLQYAIESIRKSLAVYAPDGGMPEGISYWSHATIYMAYFLSSLDSAIGTDYGLSSMEGISETGYYPIYVQGMKGTFNIGDAGSNIITTAPQMFWFANKYKNQDFSYFALKGNHPMNLIWYRKQKKEKSDITNLSLDRVFMNSEIGLITMRSGWNSDATFVGIHAGNNQQPHGDLDIGDFVFDTSGVQWAYELGSDNYNLPGYFDMNSGRWNYYRKRAEGQNTLVVNPNKGPDQNIKASATITDFSSTDRQGFTIINMSSAYERDAISVRRGIALTGDRTIVVLQDELKLKAPSEVYWFMHTKSKIEISKDKKTVTLHLSGKRLYGHIVSPAQGHFSIMDAKPLPSSPNPAGQGDNNDIKKLAIHLNGVKDTTLSVIFTTDKGKIEREKDWKNPLPLSKWSTSGVMNSN